MVKLTPYNIIIIMDFKVFPWSGC